MRRHRLDLLSLVFGVVFLLAAAAFASETFDLSVLRFEWLAAGVLLVVGAGLLLTARSSHERKNGS